jgi:hypothetical protein
MDTAAGEQTQLPESVAGGTKEVILHFPYVPEEHAESLSLCKPERWQRRLIRAAGALLAATALLPLGFGLLDGEATVPLLRYTVPLIALGAFFFWGGPAITRHLAVQHRRKEGIEDGRQIEKRVFSPEGFTPGLRWARPVPWSQVEEVEETDAFFLVYVVHSDPVYVPKHALTPEQDVALRRILREAGFLKRGSRQAALPGDRRRSMQAPHWKGCSSLMNRLFKGEVQ